VLVLSKTLSGFVCSRALGLFSFLVPFFFDAKFFSFQRIAPVRCHDTYTKQKTCRSAW
jgi:hypothetical protein